MPKPVRSLSSLHLSTRLARKTSAFPVKCTSHGFFSAKTHGPNGMRRFTRDSTRLWNPTHEQGCSLNAHEQLFLLLTVLPIQGRQAMFSQSLQGTLGKQTTAKCLRDDSLGFTVTEHEM